MLTRERLQDFTRNGPKAVPTFPAAEMQRRLDAIRGVMADGRHRRRAVHLLPQHQLLLGLPLLRSSAGRYGLVVTPDASTSISRRHRRRPALRGAASASNVTYTDWQKDNYFHAVRTAHRRRPPARHRVRPRHPRHAGPAEGGVPAMELVDIAAPAMRLRMVKSAEEIAHITEMARIADLGGAACVEATKVGVPEHEVALHSTATHGARDRQDLAARRAAGHLDLVPVRHQHRRRPQPGDLAPDRAAATSSRSTASRWSPATTSRSSARSSPRPRPTSTSGSGRSTARSTTAARSCSSPATAAPTSPRS